MEILGLLVVAIMLMGLVSALSMGVIERTREVGILRCLGARARHIRRVFSAEAVVLAVLSAGLFGVLLGWLMYQGLLALFQHNAASPSPQDFPPGIPLITLAGVLVLTLIVIRGPLRRATRIQPGTALQVPVMIHLIRWLIRKAEEPHRHRRPMRRPRSGGDDLPVQPRV